MLRECVRLCDNHLVLPTGGIGLSQTDLSEFGRFELRADLEGDRLSIHLEQRSLGNPIPEQLSVDIHEVLRFDPELRRTGHPDLADGVLRRLSPYANYSSPTQKSAVRALLTMPASGALLISMPTGSGKSLLFQLGVRWWRENARDEKPSVLVIVPTVALALDHEQTLREVPGLQESRAFLGSLSQSEKREILDGFRHGDIPILLMAPEAAFGTAREDLIRSAQSVESGYSSDQGRLHTVFLDEAHIIESWGRSFRPDFQRLPGLIAELRRHNPQLTVVLLSATISSDARRLLRQQYASSNPFLEVSACCPRSEFDFVSYKFDRGDHRDAAVIRLMDIVPRPALLYTTRVDHSEMLFQLLRAKGYARNALFTGETDAVARNDVVRRWRKGELDVVVATSAFGMGIDKNDVRTVVHACLPEDASRYYQEVGRAGRDGHQATAVLLWCDEDERVARSLASGQLMRESTATERWRAIVEDCRRRIPSGSSPFTYEPGTGRPILDVSLDAAPSRLGGITGARNRAWNASLLNQLQRYEAAEILSVQEERGHWTVSIRDPRILDENEEGDRRLAEILAARPEEVQQSLRRFRAFKRCITKDREECLLSNVFQLVEAGAPLVQPCGRCPACRRYEIAPPEIAPQGGIGSVWRPEKSRPSTWVIFPQDEGFSDPTILIARLARIGVKQFIVPDGFGAKFVPTISEHRNNPGFVLESRHVDQGWRAAVLPTAVLFNTTMSDQVRAGALVSTLNEQIGAHTVLFFIAPPSTRIDNKPISEASIHAPLAESQLDEWSRKYE